MFYQEGKASVARCLCPYLQTMRMQRHYLQWQSCALRFFRIGKPVITALFNPVFFHQLVVHTFQGNYVLFFTIAGKAVFL